MPFRLFDRGSNTKIVAYPDPLPLSPALLANKKFMMKTLVHCPSLLNEEVSESIFGDPDLVST